MSKRTLRVTGKIKIIEITEKNYRKVFPEVNDPRGFQRIEFAMPAIILCGQYEKINPFQSLYHFNLIKDLTMRHAREN